MYDQSICLFKDSVDGSMSSRFLDFEEWHLGVGKQKTFAYECKKTWFLANFENIDPTFY